MFSSAARVVQIDRCENVRATVKWREQTTRANCARARAKLFPEFIRVPSAGGTDIKINVRITPVEGKGRERKGRVWKIRANFDDEVSSKHIEIAITGRRAGPQRESTAKVMEIARRDPVALNFYASPSRVVLPRSLMIAPTRVTRAAIGENNFSSLLFCAITHSLKRGYQFAWNRMNFYDFPFFSLSFFIYPLYPALLSALPCFFRFIFSSVFHSNGKGMRYDVYVFWFCFPANINANTDLNASLPSLACVEQLFEHFQLERILETLLREFIK